jgi:autophagy-related protein 5
MGQLKEADFIRWGNTKRMTGLRKQDQDGIWEGIKERKSVVSFYVCASQYARRF